jgi:hypothetical protein
MAELRVEPLELNPSAVYEVYVWARWGALERERRPPPPDPTSGEVLAWEYSALSRIAAAVDFYFSEYHSHFRASVQVARWGFLKDPPDAAGVVMLSAYLEQQVQHWGAVAAGDGPRRREAEARLALHRTAAQRFHATLGVGPDALRDAAAQMNLDEDDRAHSHLCWREGGVVEPGDPESLVSPEEEKAEEQRQMDAARRAREAKR